MSSIPTVCSQTHYGNSHFIENLYTTYGTNIGSHYPLRKKINDEDASLTLEEGIELLAYCVKCGEKEAEKAACKDVVLIMGNTGSGKSTTINYLSGCEMVSVMPQLVGAPGKAHCIEVSPYSQTPQIAIVGHTGRSETIIPQVVTDYRENITYCDFPGFFDKRGPEICMATAMNIKKLIEAARSIKVILLIQHAELCATRQRGLHDMLKIMLDLFGAENFKASLRSIKIGITRMLYSESIEDLSTYFQDASIRYGLDFSQIIFICDPLERYDTCLTRAQIIREIKTLPGIKTCNAVFHVALTENEKTKLFKIGQEMMTRITSEMASHRFESMSNLLQCIGQLSIIEHAAIDRIFRDSHAHLDREFDRLKKQTIGFSPSAPNWRIVSYGLNIESRCQAIWCKAYGQAVWTQHHFGDFKLTQQARRLFCPSCGTKILERTVSSIGLYHCKYSYSGNSSIELKRGYSLWDTGLSEEFSAVFDNGFVKFEWSEILRLSRFCEIHVKRLE